MKTWKLMGLATVCVTAPVAAQVMTPAKYVATAGASDLYERTSSQLVLKSTADPKVRTFAQMMVTDHAKSYAASGTAAPLRRVAAGIVPVVEHHISMLQSM